MADDPARQPAPGDWRRDERCDFERWVRDIGGGRRGGGVTLEVFVEDVGDGVVWAWNVLAEEGDVADSAEMSREAAMLAADAEAPHHAG